MAEFVVKDYSVTINGVDLSTDVQSFSIPYSADAVESTGMGVTSKEFLTGLTSWTATITMRQNHDASKVDATLFPLVGAVPFAVIFKPTSGAVSATNPSFTGNAILTGYDVASASVGGLATTSPGLQGTSTLTRAEA